MNPHLCSLLLWLYPRGCGTAFINVTLPDFCARIPEALALGLVETPDVGDALDILFLRLTAKGQAVCYDGLESMNAVFVSEP